MTPLQHSNDAENKVAELQKKLAQFRIVAEKLLRAYEHKVLIPPDKIGSQWDELKKLLEQS